MSGDLELEVRDSALQERVRVIIAGVAGIDLGFNADADIFRELGVESASALDLLIRLEEDFAVAIPDEAFGEARSLSMMTKLISDLSDRRS